MADLNNSTSANDPTKKNDKNDNTSDYEDVKSDSSVKCKTPKSAKRRGSPLYKTSVKRQTPSRAQSNMSFSEMIVLTFKEPAFIKGITPILTTIISPLIQTSIDQAVKSTTEHLTKSILANIEKETSKMNETVMAQAETIKQLQAENSVQKQRIADLNDKLVSSSTTITNLQSDIKSISKSTNELEQYSRRNSLRITNLKFKSDIDESHLKKQVVGFINSKMLNPESSIALEDVERCHPVGRKNERGRQQILLKFHSYHTKHLVYGSKSKLKNNPDRIFITEDLTHNNYQIIKALLPLKKSGKITSFWTMNGKIMAKQTDSSRPIRIICIDDVVNIS